ncbi:hypothetical protein [Hymenobacter ruricola]|uniref:DUF3823 domain-containing protein n=1 Tax=Hymenobacter ruricola TaxID=2791023 RepID=A0ABS0I5X4_9BACT|nr:hypothetical protein [Hymenobacter ruricola]MBF9222372.1 hypothetical protein [Hymenobacter ruricola]
MNLFRTFSMAAAALAGLSLSSCLNAPEYPVEPSIDFKSLTMVRNKPAGQTEIDTLKFALDFRDGDGDLGLSDDDIKVAPWNSTTDGPNKRGYSYNYIIQPYKKNPVTKQFEKFINVGGVQGEYDGRFLRLDEADARPAPLKGTLNYKLPINIDGSPFFPGDVLRFEISILDRSLHQSNTITTTEVTLGQ